MFHRKKRKAHAPNQHSRILAVLVFLCALSVFAAGCRDRREEVFFSGEKTREEDEPTETAAQSEESEPEAGAFQEPAVIYVDVGGAVCYPGVYELSEGARVYEAIDAAGGFTADAVPGAVNQAAVLTDAVQLTIPRQGETEAESLAEGGGIQAGTVPGEASAPESGLVNLNTADKAGLMTLSGIGEARAQAILDYRESSGGFASIEEIRQVSGIGEGIFSRIREYITV